MYCTDKFSEISRSLESFYASLDIHVFFFWNVFWSSIEPFLAFSWFQCKNFLRLSQEVSSSDVMCMCTKNNVKRCMCTWKMVTQEKHKINWWRKILHTLSSAYMRGNTETQYYNYCCACTSHFFKQHSLNLKLSTILVTLAKILRQFWHNC